MRFHTPLAMGVALVTVAIACAVLSCSRSAVSPSGGVGSSAPKATVTAYRAMRPSSSIAYGSEGAVPDRPLAAAANASRPVATSEPIIIVVLPEATQSGATGAAAAASGSSPRTYHLVVTTDMRTATVAIDGHPPAAARVQRVRSESPVAPVRTASGSAAYEVTPANVRGADSRLPARSSASRLTLGSRPVVMNPNGAPILD